MKLEQFISNIKEISINKIISEKLKSSEYQEFITGLNKQRLSTKGEDTDGKQIKTFFSNFPNVYAARTIDIKQEKSGISGITKHVTLYDTGFFYKSMKAVVRSSFFYITADRTRLKQLEDNIVTDKILGLTKDDKEELSKKLIPDVINELHKTLFSGIS